VKALKRVLETVSLAQLRRFLVARQGYTTRFRRARAADVEAEVRRLSCVQLDSVSTVERAHRLTLASRVGCYPRGTVSRLLGQGRLVEYWAHEACLLAADDWPLLRPRMGGHPWWGDLIAREPALAHSVLTAVRDRGPLGSRDFEGKGAGGMWNLKPAKRMLEALWSAGELVIAGRQGFQRLYDLPERVLPPELLEAESPPDDEWLRQLTLRAIGARGALTNYGVREHWRLPGGAALLEPHLDALVRAGTIRRLEVEDGLAPVYVRADAVLDGDRPSGGVLLSPFDNLLWDRPYVERVFGFRHLIEIYKPAPQREYGYYVLPFLYGDRLVGRADLKSLRSKGVLQVKAFHLEPGVRRSRALEGAVERALDRLSRAAGLERVEAARI
jgi:uncharacterized protein YcaQ